MDGLNRLCCTVLVALCWTSHWNFHVVSLKDCLSPLGMEDGRIKDTQIKAWSSLNYTALPKYGRLNEKGGFGGWCPKRMNRTGPFFSQYLQVNLNIIMRIRAITTQGREGGNERVERYTINYAPNRTNYPHSWKWLRSENGLELKVFKGNMDSQQHTSMLRPPLLADGIRLVPEMHANTLVCIRFELLGCQIKNGLTAYNMPQGNTLEGRYNFTDSIYDGLIKNNSLSSGLGFLTDGSLALADYDIDNGLGWIGWHALHTPTPYIIFEFLDTRIFRNVTIHCNVRDRASIQLFCQVEVSFSNDGVTFNAKMSHRPKTITSGTGWKNHNVTIDLCQNTGKVVRFSFSYAGDWILMSEISFNSVPLGSKSPPKVFCALASSKTQHLGTTSCPTKGTLVDVGCGNVSH
ncbi:discoidin domain-containing receptor 2-like isoform X2 [Acropora muricata]|uniref:discoidin domain-containing receptor 2-like isoform X2 n=1 Tax=Acropora muricata TaxID=159855 RepID=UPI0034E556B0